MTKLNMINIVPIYPRNTEFTISEIRRQNREVGLTKFALSLSWHPQTTPVSAAIPTMIAAFEKVRGALKNEVSVGALIQSTQGHGWSGKVPLTRDPLQRIVYIDGEQVERMCPLDPDFRRYICACVEATVKAGAEFLLVDDDFGLRYNECFCPRHIEAFNAAAGTNLTREGLAEIIKTRPYDDPQVKIFSELRLKLAVDFAKEIRDAIDKVNPAIRCGFCAPWNGYGFLGAVSRALAGNTEPFIRICNATYGNQPPEAFFPVCRRNAQLANLLDFPEKIAEGDTFPQCYFSESARMFHAHLTLDILSGLRGAKLWMSEFNFPKNAESQKRYEETFATHSRFYEKLSEMLGGGVVWNGVAGALLRPPELLMNHPLLCDKLFREKNWIQEILAPFGFPATYANYGTPAICTLTAEEAEYFSAAELKKFFSGPLLLDASAAKFLSADFSRFMGVTADDGDDSFSFAQEKEVDSSRSQAGFWESSCAHLTLTGATPFTEFFTGTNRSFDEGTYVAPAMTFFENELGGRVVVSAWDAEIPYFKRWRARRREWLLAALDFLRGDTFEMCVDAKHLCMVKHGILKSGAELLAVLNLALDTLPEIPVRMKRTPKSVEILGADGSQKSAAFRKTADGIAIEIAAEICVPRIFIMTF